MAKQPINRKQKMESNDPIYWTIIIVMFGLSISTLIHDPILHGIAATINGWSIDSFDGGGIFGMTGSTSVIAPATAPWLQLWFYFMFPSLAIFILTAIIAFIKPEKSIMVGGIIVMSLNLPSLNPTIVGSDAYNAVDMLVKHGFSEGLVIIAHYLLFFLILVLWGLYLYVVIENQPNDARKRVENIYH